LAIASADGANHAVIAAASKWYANYRHQADACHAYQVVLANGVPAENIVMMLYDDVATDEDNPFPGKLFNAPSEGEGYDVRAGCDIHYRGDDVSAANFLAVMTGTAPGRKLESTAEDNVFVYVVDHGAPSLIAFPNDVLHKTELQNALQQMSDAKMFKKLVFYLETCFSGSMFEDMNIPNVYAVSAASPTESSWGTYCSSFQDPTPGMVNGQKIGVCLGDLFSVTWMGDSEEHDLTQESLDDQFDTLFTTVGGNDPNSRHHSQVMQWSDTTFTSDHVSDFIGSAGTAEESTSPDKGTLNGRHLDLASMYSSYQLQGNSEGRLDLGVQMYAVLQQQLNAEVVYRRFVEVAYPDDVEQQKVCRRVQHKGSNMECEKLGHQTMRQQCAELFDASSGFALQFHQQVVNVCHDIVSGGLDLDVAMAVTTACQDVTTHGALAMSGLTV